MKIILILVALIVLIGAPAALFFLSSSSTIELAPPITALGVSNEIGVRVTNPHGIKLARVTIEQGNTTTSESITSNADRFLFWREKKEPAVIKLRVNADPKGGFRSGPAKLRVEVESNDLRGKLDSREYNIPIVLEPPRLSVDGLQHYINMGGAELVTFTVSGSWSEAGVKVGNYTFRSYPIPGAKSENERFSLFAFPYDLPADTVPRVYARNAGGQEVTGSFWFKVFPKKWRHRTLPISDQFIEKVVNELDAGGQGSPLDRFLKINREMRKQNNQTLADLRNQSEPKMLWEPPFEQLSNSQVEAFFADYRTYTYENKQVDEQVHLGFDLSKTAHAPVVASNSGKVVFAGPLGIYGNCVVIDHGYTLQSIYAHLSNIGVRVGQMVKKREEIGQSGATGLAGGDHLHYSMMIDGVQVNPVEWWDAHWIKDRVTSKLPQHAAQAESGKE